MGTDQQVLSEEQREKFERDGYLVADFGFSEQALERAVSDLDGMFGGEPREQDGMLFYPNRIQDAWKISEKRQGDRAAPPVTGGCWRSLYDRKPLPFQTLNFPVGTEQSPTRTRSTSTQAGGYMCRRVGRARGHGHGERPARLLPGQPEAPRGRMAATSGVEAKRENYRALRAVHRRPDRARGARAEIRDDPKGRGARVVREPASRRRAPAGPQPHAPQPGDPLLLRGLPVLHPMSSRDDYVHVLEPNWISYS